MTAIQEVEASRFCIRCGKSDTEVVFRSPLAQKCEKCDKATEAERRVYHREYHKARGIAVDRLIKRHRDEFDREMVKARREVAQRVQVVSAKKASKKSAAKS